MYDGGKKWKKIYYIILISAGTWTLSNLGFFAMKLRNVNWKMLIFGGLFKQFSLRSVGFLGPLFSYEAWAS